jgi:hypothetical protein
MRQLNKQSNHSKHSKHKLLGKHKNIIFVCNQKKAREWEK